jgi:hypothetical protein
MRPEMPMTRVTNHVLHTTPLVLCLLAGALYIANKPILAIVAGSIMLFGLGMMLANLLWKRAYGRVMGESSQENPLSEPPHDSKEPR